MNSPLCQTCINIFHFPECCAENLTDCVRIITNCANYSRHDMGERSVITSEQPTEHSQSESHRASQQKASACGQSETELKDTAYLSAVSST